MLRWARRSLTAFSPIICNLEWRVKLILLPSSLAITEDLWLLWTQQSRKTHSDHRSRHNSICRQDKAEEPNTARSIEQAVELSSLGREGSWSCVLYSTYVTKVAQQLGRRQAVSNRRCSISLCLPCTLHWPRRWAAWREMALHWMYMKVFSIMQRKALDNTRHT